MIKSSIRDTRNGNTLKIENDGATNTYVIPRPPSDIDQIALPFSQYLSTNGESTGTTSMLVNGSTTNVDFYIKAKSYDVYINTIIFEIADAGAVLNKFGALSALTNGLEFYYFNQTNGKYTIESSLKTNYDFVKLANFEPAYGTAANAFQLTNAISAAEAYVGVIDMEDVFGLQWGLKLRANTTDTLGFTVKDNITALDAMTIKVYGIRI
jgi:hypothetical protein